MYDNFARVPAESVLAGDICALTGLGDVTIGETICDKDVPTALPTITVSSTAYALDYHPQCRPQILVIIAAAMELPMNMAMAMANTLAHSGPSVVS